MERRVFTKDILLSVNRMAEQQGYNRVVEPAFLEQLPDQIFVPWFTMLHEHKAGKACEPHVRCCFKHDGQHFAIDVEMGCWDLLPTVSSVLEPRNTPEPVTSES
jgi:hypothetical protein